MAQKKLTRDQRNADQIQAYIHTIIQKKKSATVMWYKYGIGYYWVNDNCYQKLNKEKETELDKEVPSEFLGGI